MKTNTNKKTSLNRLKIKSVQNLKEASEALDKITKRTSGRAQRKAINIVESILNEVEETGDKAISKYTEKFDGFIPNPIEVDPIKLKKAWDSTPLSLQNALKTAYKRIKNFHTLQVPKDILIEGEYGEQLGRRWKPVQKAGIYVPGGRAAYPSTVLMNAIPALVAGVEEIAMVTPAGLDGEINTTVLAAAHLVGITKVFRIGGAQAIAGLAFGTESIPKVDVISGPGNLYVTLAKKFVYGKVGIDSLAGPSEVLIIADKSANKTQVAADLLAQAEHDPLAAAILITTESNLVNTITTEIENQLENHPRAEICKSSLENWGLIIHCKDIKSCAKLSDEFAPEHLELLIQNPNDLAKNIKNAGAIFLGPWSPEAIGDYLAGPNHTLPTSGTARFSGALSVETFMKNTSTIQFTSNALEKTKKDVIELALSEGLHSHAQSIKIRSIKTSQEN
ncbi:histidinol dehydrogenase [Prochlorococcus sp. MIT 1223]|uniref:histidinol dehydrogenase n=1 Tax=Prochlorococcus sp. MIT 1223 TaxID=3096217 RepID=UPI002A755CA8|nr:histidinol dehydrogenase [Prochlorococcus sp. MIT 1223]